VTLPPGCRLKIGYALEAGVLIESVTLNGEATDYEVRSTHRSSEVFAQVSAPGFVSPGLVDCELISLQIPLRPWRLPLLNIVG
jgi:hypothetical protein